MLRIKRYLYPVFLLLFVCTLVSPIQAETLPEKTVAINPLTIHSTQDVGYLQAGIRSMIASRLAADAGVKVVIIPPGKPSPENGAYDYRIDGSLTTFGSGLSLDVEVIDLEKKENPRHFYATAATENDIINAVDTLASEISRDVFSVPKAPEITETPAASAPAPSDSSSLSDSNAHPERAFIAGESKTGMLGSDRGGFRQFEKTQTLNYGIQTFAIGDIDGDQVEDFILGQPSGIKCYHMIGGRLQQFSYYPLSSGVRVLHISMADLDGDKKDEIYVAAKVQGRPLSLGLVWQGEHPAEIFRDNFWYIRAFQDPISGWLLAGQKGADARPLEREIYQLRVKDNKLEEAGSLGLPVGVTLFSFTLADIDGDGNIEIILLDKNDYLQVLRSNGTALWASSGIFGGSPTYIGKEHEAGEDTDKQRNALQPEKWSKVEVPPRIIPADLNNDGITDIIVCRNNPRFSKILANARSYDSTELFGLAWNGVSLDTLWQTKKIDGFITDIAYRPAADEQKAKLYAGLILPTSLIDIISKATSTLLTFDIDTSKEKQN